MITRRVFLRRSASALAAGILVPQVLKAQTLGAAPSDQLRVALIGCKSMGWKDLTTFMKHAGVSCVALCDIDNNILESCADQARKLWGTRPETYTDYRRVLDRKDVDAVIIATPDHWHCLMMTDACAAGKDVYVEGPAAHSLAECDVMAAAQQRYGRVVQVGQPLRSSELWNEMKRIVASGQLGTIARVNVWANMDLGSITSVAQDGPAPQGVDYDLWLGPAPKRAFNAYRFHNSWCQFWDYGGGLIAYVGTHLLDVALAGMNVASMPLRVVGSGANHTVPGNKAETFDNLSVFYQFPKFLMQWSNVGIEGGPFGMNRGVEFKGTDASLVVNDETMTLVPVGKKLEPQTWKASNDAVFDHIGNFIDCARQHRTATACTIGQGAFSAKYAHLGNIAARTGEALVYDPQHHTFHNRKADRLIAPAYRKPWRLPKS